MDIQFTSLHQIDNRLNSVLEIDIANQSEDLKAYIDLLIDEITRSKTKRLFQFKSDTTEVRAAITKFIEGDFNNSANIIATRLLNTEIKTQKEIEHLKSIIPKGSLFQAVLTDKNVTLVIISKADHNNFLDEVDFTLKTGLPWEKRIFKAFLVRFEDNTPQDTFVYDTGRMAAYWWDEFLELTETYTDSYNTKRSLDLLDSKVFNPLKPKYPADYTIIRNDSIGYFRNNDEFKLDEYVDQTIKNYAPIDPDFPKEKTIEKIQDLPEKWKFDTRFKIQKEDINKRRRTDTIPLTENIELVLKDYVNDLGNTITAEKDAENNKYIKIRTNIGYERFKREL